MKIRKNKHVLGRRPAQAPPGWADRWLIAGTRVDEPYPRWIPRRSGGGNPTDTDDPATAEILAEIDDGQLNLIDGEAGDG